MFVRKSTPVALLSLTLVGCFGPFGGPKVIMQRTLTDRATMAKFEGRGTSSLGWTGVLLVLYQDANQLDDIRQLAGEVRGTFEETLKHSAKARGIVARHGPGLHIGHCPLEFDGRFSFSVSKQTHSQFHHYAIIGYSGTILGRGPLWE